MEFDADFVRSLLEQNGRIDWTGLIVGCQVCYTPNGHVEISIRVNKSLSRVQEPVWCCCYVKLIVEAK